LLDLAGHWGTLLVLAPRDVTLPRSHPLAEALFPTGCKPPTTNPMDRQERTADRAKPTTQAEESAQSGRSSLSGIGDADERARTAGIPGVDI
jgi:hypothetical protein